MSTETSKRKVAEKQKLWLDIMGFMSVEYDYEVEVIADYQIRLSSDKKTVDIYPKAARYHNITRDVRGDIPQGDVEKFIAAQFGNV